MSQGQDQVGRSSHPNIPAMDERPVTVGYLKSMFERLSLPDDAKLFVQSNMGWISVGPEGEEVLFVTNEQYEKIIKWAHFLRIKHPVQYRRMLMAIETAFNEFKRETGQ